MGSVNVGGLVSGIDTDSIIKGLLEIQQKQIDQFTTRQTTVKTKQAAYQSLQTQLLSLRTSATSLASPVNNPFDTRLVTVSQPDALLATASPKAATGTYQLHVNSLASAQQVASQSFNDADAAITQGTFSIRIGNQAQADIEIDSTNNTLSGLADAINFANVGVSASIVQSSPTSYQLLLTSQRTGTANAISVTNNLAASGGGAIQPAFDFDNPVQEAADAQVTLGSGSGALTVSSSTNTISNLINGVSLNLLAADPAKTISVTVAPDTDKATKAVDDFVTAYNGILDYIDQVTKYDPGSDTAAALTGDFTVLSIRSQLQNVLQGIVSGGSAQVNRLSSLGITTNDTGRLTVNDAKLADLINGNVKGVTTADLRHLFALDGTGSNGGVSFLFGGSATKESISPYQVDVSRAAERASVTGGSAVAASTVIDSSNNTLTLNLDGVEATITLSDGTYTPEQLAAEVEGVVNSSPELIGRSISAGIDATGELSLTSGTYGSSSRVTVGSGTALNALGFAGGETDIGVNVAGSFIVNGKSEDATGSGRVLTGVEGNANTDGLQVKVTLSPGQISMGVEGTVSVSRGITARLNAVIDKLLDSQTGTLTTVDAGFNDQIQSIQDSIDRQQAIFDKQKQDLQDKFNAMESALEKLQSTSSLLGSQLASLSSMGSSSSSSS
jgi:flagellar hook-associated protein 2